MKAVNQSIGVNFSCYHSGFLDCPSLYSLKAFRWLCPGGTKPAITITLERGSRSLIGYLSLQANNSV